MSKKDNKGLENFNLELVGKGLKKSVNGIKLDHCNLDIIPKMCNRCCTYKAIFRLDAIIEEIEPAIKIRINYCRFCFTYIRDCMSHVIQTVIDLNNEDEMTAILYKDAIKDKTKKK